MKEREIRKLTGDNIDEGYSSIDGLDRKRKPGRPRLVRPGEEPPKGGDEDIDDLISLQDSPPNSLSSSEDSSIVEVQHQRQQRMLAPVQGVRRRGRPRKYEYISSTNSNVAHTISSSSVQNMGENTPSDHSPLPEEDEDDDYSGFDDFSLEERQQGRQILQRRRQ